MAIKNWHTNNKFSHGIANGKHLFVERRRRYNGKEKIEEHTTN
jgi:hypothetical protein